MRVALPPFVGVPSGGGLWSFIPRPPLFEFAGVWTVTLKPRSPLVKTTGPSEDFDVDGGPTGGGGRPGGGGGGLGGVGGGPCGGCGVLSPARTSEASSQVPSAHTIPTPQLFSGTPGPSTFWLQQGSPIRPHANAQMLFSLQATSTLDPSVQRPPGQQAAPGSPQTEQMPPTQVSPGTSSSSKQMISDGLSVGSDALGSWVSGQHAEPKVPQAP